MKMKRMVALGALIAVMGILVVAGVASAAVQVIDGTLSASISMTTSPSPTVAWVFAPSGANSASGGTVGVTANTPYILTVAADKTRLTEYITASSAYETTSPKTLFSPLSVLAAWASGSGVSSGTIAAGTTATTIAAGAGLTVDTYSITLSQPTTIADPPLAAGRTYHIVLTYTASAPL